MSRDGTSSVTGSGAFLISAFASCLRHLINTIPSTNVPHLLPTTLLSLLYTFVMSAEEEQYEEGGMSAPGAPTPVSALEVRVVIYHSFVYSPDTR
jgi:hypothetical protein